jgi:hypothetical protein
MDQAGDDLIWSTYRLAQLGNCVLSRAFLWSSRSAPQVTSLQVRPSYLQPDVATSSRHIKHPPGCETAQQDHAPHARRIFSSRHQNKSIHIQPIMYITFSIYPIVRTSTYNEPDDNDRCFLCGLTSVLERLQRQRFLLARPCWHRAFISG